MGVEFRGLFPAVILLALWPVSAQQRQPVVWSEQEKPILEQIRGLRGCSTISVPS
jgi:hypothetical protein